MRGLLMGGALAIRIGLGSLGSLVLPDSSGTGVGRRSRGFGWVRTHCWVLRKRTGRGCASGGG